MFNSNKKSFPNSLSDIHLAFMPFDLFKSDIAVKTSFVQKGQIDGLPDGPIDIRTDKQMRIRTDRRTDGWKQIDELTERKSNGKTTF